MHVCLQTLRHTLSTYAAVRVVLFVSASWLDIIYYYQAGLVLKSKIWMDDGEQAVLYV